MHAFDEPAWPTSPEPLRMTQKSGKLSYFGLYKPMTCTLQVDHSLLSGWIFLILVTQIVDNTKRLLYTIIL